MTVPNTWVQGDIDALKASIASGVLTVSYDGPPARTITYQSLAAMRALLAEMVVQVNTLSGARRRVRLAKTKKGFGNGSI